MSKAPKIDPQEQARILSEALPHMQRYDEEIVAVKYGGHAMGQEQMARDFARDIVLPNKPPSTRCGPWRRSADRAMLNKLGIKRNSPQDCASLTPRPSRSSKWFSPPRSTSRSSATSPPVARRSGCAGMATWAARKVSRTVVDPDSNIERLSISVSSASRKVDLSMLIR